MLFLQRRETSPFPLSFFNNAIPAMPGDASISLALSLFQCRLHLFLSLISSLCLPATQQQFSACHDARSSTVEDLSFYACQRRNSEVSNRNPHGSLSRPRRGGRRVVNIIIVQMKRLNEAGRNSSYASVRNLSREKKSRRSRTRSRIDARISRTI